MMLDDDNSIESRKYLLHSNPISTLNLINPKHFENLLNIPETTDQFEWLHNIDLNSTNYGYYTHPIDNYNHPNLNTDHPYDLINLLQQDSFPSTDIATVPQIQFLYPYQQHMLRLSNSSFQLYPNNLQQQFSGQNRNSDSEKLHDWNNSSNINLQRIQESLHYNINNDEKKINPKINNPLVTSNFVKSFACSSCPSRFSRKDELRRHEKIHIGIKTLTCPFCDKTFIRSDHRRTHIRTHTGEKPYTCEICFKSFARSDERTRHIKIHTKDNVRRRKRVNIEQDNNLKIERSKEKRDCFRLNNYSNDRSNSPSTVISID